MKRSRFSILIAIFFVACNSNPASNNTTITDNSNPPPQIIKYTIAKVYPHDTSSYTEGLEWVNNSLYESDSSKLFERSLDGRIIRSIKIPKEYFGEGITMLNNKIYQLTWREHKVFIYDASTFKKINELSWPYEGWGMTNNGKNLIISTGSSILYFVDPENFKILNQVSVTDNYGPVGKVNELEYVNNFIYANVYETDYIYKIDPETGSVIGKLDLSGILDSSGMPVNLQTYSANTGFVLNGIAYDSVKNSFYVTGKLWPALFEIKLNN